MRFYTHVDSTGNVNMTEKFVLGEPVGNSSVANARMSMSECTINLCRLFQPTILNHLH